MEEVGQKLARKLEKKLVTTVEEVGQILEMGFCLIFTQICWLYKLGCASFLHIGVLTLNETLLRIFKRDMITSRCSVKLGSL